MKYRKICFFPCRTKNNRNLLDGHHDVNHHTEIVNDDRDYSNIGEHEQAMLSTKTEELIN